MRHTTTIIIAFALSHIGCSKSSSPATSASTGYSAAKPSGVMGAIQEGVESTATQLTSVGASSIRSAKKSDVSALFATSECTAHGDPNGITESDPKYPGLLTYCKVSINDGSPDTVQGGFEIVKNVSCAVEKQNPTFDGVTRTVTITFDSDCFTDAQLVDMGGAGTTMSVDITASAPASFNANFARGIEISMSTGMTYRLAANVSSTQIDFISYETEGATKSGVTAGSLNMSTGEIRFEARMERIDCTTSGSCGWNRHLRIYANLAVSGGVLGALEDISFAYSNTSAPPGQSSYGGVLVTASGDLSSGIKARLWQATDGSSGAPTGQSDYAVVGNWSELTNTKCYTESSDDAGTCGSGLARFTSGTGFVLSGTHASPADFLAAMTGLSYSTIDLDEDIQ